VLRTRPWLLWYGYRIVEGIQQTLKPLEAVMNLGRETRRAFGLTVALLAFLATPAPASIQLSAQITNHETFHGTITGRVAEAYRDVDLYLFLVAAETVFSLHPASPDGSYTWRPGIHTVSSCARVALDDWVSLYPVDFSPVRDERSQAYVVLVLTREGSDLSDPENWLDYQVVVLITDPLDRRPGQSFFLSSGSAGLDDYGSGGEPYPVQAPEASEDREGVPGVVEPDKPDIFKISGDTLYYANGSAGRLQLIDLKDPSQPALLASLVMEGMPLELYVVDDYCFFLEQSSGSQGQYVTLRTYETAAGAQLRETGRLRFPRASYKVSRRLGEKIFLVATDCRAGEDEDVEPPGTGASVVYAVDVSSPEQPRILARDVLSGYDPNVYLDNRYLMFLVRENWSRTVLQIYDLAATGAPLAAKTTIRIPGHVPSEYHLHADGSLLHVVYRRQELRRGSVLAVYDLGQWEDIQEVGRVEGIAPGEELYATRFSGKRAYVVTYERQDPLWVIDLQYPEKPEIIGELEVPGWSEYMEFHDDRLIALGFDDRLGGRLVSVALFSVENPETPTLLDRVTPFAGELDYTHSEAIEDDRAFHVNYSSGIIVLPLSHYHDGQHSGLAIVRLADGKSAFSSQHYVESDFRVLRGTEADSAGIVVGMGDAAINTIDSGNQPEPVILGRLRLARNVEHAVRVDEWGRLWALGGDFYCCGTAELFIFETGNLDSPRLEVQTDLNRPVLTIGERLGVLFSRGGAVFRAIDPESVGIGRPCTLGDEYPWSLQSPLVSGSRFYLATTHSVPYPLPVEPTSGSADRTVDSSVEAPESSITPPYPQPMVQWTLKRFECEGIDNPEPLSDLSIPGRPLGFTEEGKLICVEEVYAYPWYGADGAVREPSPYPAVEPGLRLDVLSISGDRAILEHTRLFEAEAFGTFQAIMDIKHIYLCNQSEDGTTVLIVNPNNLAEVRRVTLEGSLLPVTAENGRVVFATGSYWLYPLPVDVLNGERTAPHPGVGYSVVYDLGEDVPRLLVRLDGEYLRATQVAIGEEGLFVARGYGGTCFIAYNRENENSTEQQ
jgi:hypothetical protein